MVVSATPLLTNKIPVFSKERNFDEKITKSLMELLQEQVFELHVLLHHILEIG